MKNPKFNFNDKGIAEAHSLLANSFNANTPHDLCKSWIKATFARRALTGKASFEQYKSVKDLEETLQKIKNDIKAHALEKGYGYKSRFIKKAYKVPEKEIENFYFKKEFKSWMRK